MSFSLDLSRAIKKAKGKQELVVKKVMLEAFSKVVMKSPVGNPALWASNATAVEYNNAVSEYNSALRQDPANLNKAGRLRRGLKSHDSMSLNGKGYVGGRFRGNWSASQGGYSKSPSENIDKNGRATIAAIRSSVASMSLNGQTIYLTNALAYAVRLERGWSKQAPMGMVRLTLAEITAHYGA